MRHTYISRLFRNRNFVQKVWKTFPITFVTLQQYLASFYSMTSSFISSDVLIYIKWRHNWDKMNAEIEAKLLNFGSRQDHFSRFRDSIKIYQWKYRRLLYYLVHIYKISSSRNLSIGPHHFWNIRLHNGDSPSDVDVIRNCPIREEA